MHKERYAWHSNPGRTETIFQVLGRLQPARALEVLEKIKGSSLVGTFKLHRDYIAPETALEIAKRTAGECTLEDTSFSDELKIYLNSLDYSKLGWHYIDSKEATQS